MSGKRVIVVATALAALVALVVVRTHVDGWSADRAHADAWRLWESREPAMYSFDYSACSGMCEPCHARITVTLGEVTAVDAEDGCRDLGLDTAPTIETIFAFEREGRSMAMTDSSEIRYDAQWGFPASVVLHCPPDTTDCGTGVEVTDFQER